MAHLQLCCSVINNVYIYLICYYVGHGFLAIPNKYKQLDERRKTVCIKYEPLVSKTLICTIVN